MKIRGNKARTGRLVGALALLALPASAYWSYWHAPNNGTWTYSSWDATARKPPLGSFEGWSFSKDKTDTTNPPPRVAPTRP